MRVAIAGRVKAGKSTLLNALVGEELAPTDAGECTRIVTWYRDGPTYQVFVHPIEGAPAPRPFERVDGAIQVSLGIPAARVDHLTVELPSRRLREHTLIDTPGLDSLSSEVSARTLAFLEADGDGPARADAVIYLLGHSQRQRRRPPHVLPRRSTRSASCPGRTRSVARSWTRWSRPPRVAAGYAADERLRQVCPVVVPVAGLLAAASATLREDEYRCLVAIAGAAGRDRRRPAVDGGPVRGRQRRPAADRGAAPPGSRPAGPLRRAARVAADRRRDRPQCRRVRPRARGAQRRQPAERPSADPVRPAQPRAQGALRAGRARRRPPGPGPAPASPRRPRRSGPAPTSSSRSARCTCCARAG